MARCRWPGACGTVVEKCAPEGQKNPRSRAIRGTLSPYLAQTHVWRARRVERADVKLVTKETKMGSMYEAAAVLAAYARACGPGPRDGRPVASQFGVGAQDLSDLRIDLEKSAGRW
jgi:hypothetical protein